MDPNFAIVRARGIALASLMDNHCDVTKLTFDPDNSHDDLLVFSGGGIFGNCHPHDYMWHVQAVTVASGVTLQVVEAFVPETPSLEEVRNLIVFQRLYLETYL